ncbi:MAG TPA: FhaA domain-containing protein [Candidatus Cybelea sp.]|nr:FhaA domain-containing protein [Candidatus Cybelea sp.]
MSFFERIEQACAQFIERTFAKSFPSDVEPAQIARKLVATMEAQTRGEDGRPFAPSVYAVYVSPADFERLEQHREYLEEAWIDLLRDLATKVGVAFVDGEPRVTMSARPSVPLGAIAIEVGDAARAIAKFALRMIKGLPVDGVYSITGTTRVGRGDENEIVLLDPGVSRAHAVFEFDAGEPLVRDLDSTNGTYVNGRRVRVESLQDGDELRFGNTRMRFENA